MDEERAGGGKAAGPSAATEQGVNEAKTGTVRISQTYARSLIGTIIILVVLLVGTNIESLNVFEFSEREEVKGVMQTLRAQGESLTALSVGPENLKCKAAFAAVKATSKVVGNFPASAHPFPHLVLDDVFPRDYYELMLDNVIDTRDASSELFTRRSAVKPRYTLILRENVTEYSKQDSELIKQKVEFWRCHYLAYGSPEFTAALLKPFRTIVERRYNGTVKHNARKFYQAMSLVQDRSEYFITPHTDIYTKFVTNLFYLGNEEDAMALRASGTLITEPAGQAPFVPLEADDNKMTEKKRKRHEKRRKMPDFVGPSLSITTLEDFDSKKPYLENQIYKFKQMEFRPNRLVAFAPCDSSWHAVPLQHLPSGVARNTVQGFVSFKGEVPEKESCTPF